MYLHKKAKGSVQSHKQSFMFDWSLKLLWKRRLW